ncbi:MAG TPA: outer membrane lipoprotein-sorting protein [Treponema sp.]|nr:outer membrane lipoprotein-sorting protein [Treponema sp.]
MKRCSLFIVAALFAASLTAQDADSVIKASRDRISADTISTRSLMVITAKDGSTTERLLDQYANDIDDTKSTMIVFQKPTSVAGTRFLTIEKKGGSDDRWIFLPALGKVRRVASSEGSARFVGTDFSYDDISSVNRAASADTHTMLKEESIRGTPCHVIESIPKDSGFQYSKLISWIAKDSLVSERIELYDRKGNHVKTVEILETKEVQGRLSPMVTKMSTLADGTSTEIRVQILKYDDPIPAGVFTTNFLSTGRVR